MRAPMAVHPLDDEVRRLSTPGAGTSCPRRGSRSRVHLVLVGVLGRSPVRRLEDRMAGDVVDVPARDAELPTWAASVAQVSPLRFSVAMTSNSSSRVRTLLERDVGDGVP